MIKKSLDFQDNFDPKLICQELENIEAFIVENILCVFSNNAIIDQDIICKHFTLLESINPNTTCSKNLIKMFIEMNKTFPIIGNVLTLFTIYILKDLFKNKYKINKYHIYDCLETFKTNMERSINITDFTPNKEDIFDNDLFYSSDNYKHLFETLSSVLDKNFNTHIKLLTFKIFNGDMIEENNHKILTIDQGLFLKLKVFDKKNIYKSLNGTNSNLIIKDKTIKIHNILICNNVSNSFDITFLNFILNNNQLSEDNDIIIDFLNRIILANNIDVIFIIGSNIAPMIREILEDYGILVFEFLNSLNHKNITEFLSDSTQNTSIINNSLSCFTLYLNKERYSLSVEYINSSIIVLKDVNKELPFFNILIKGYSNIHLKNIKYILENQIYRFLGITKRNYALILNKRILYPNNLSQRSLDMIKFFEMNYLEDSHDIEKIIFNEILDSSQKLVLSRIITSIEKSSLSSTQSVRKFHFLTNSNEFIQCWDQFSVIIKFIVKKFYL